MVDSSLLPFEENMALMNMVVEEARAIGRLLGTEDGLTVEEYEVRLISVDQVRQSRTLFRFHHPNITFESL
jgi:fructose/tagatose bisphosphate aldolase